ncbi:hypothetical protein LSM04_006855 [Trypanosoma melophagium]|uniref:uncharacterized protein n=1 Tax=Trypanosoma melophagium TaxID=715481 RepID=UPI00351A466B|nr:hypothetical protein LSM04_006855 [Trypanosoma melophagium]
MQGTCLEPSVDRVTRLSILQQSDDSTGRRELTASFVNCSGVGPSTPPPRNGRGCTPCRVVLQGDREGVVTGTAEFARECRQRARSRFIVDGVPFVESPDVSVDDHMFVWRMKQAARIRLVNAWVRRGLMWQREEQCAQLREEARRSNAAFLPVAALNGGGGRWQPPPNVTVGNRRRFF